MYCVGALGEVRQGIILEAFIYITVVIYTSIEFSPILSNQAHRYGPFAAVIQL